MKTRIWLIALALSLPLSLHVAQGQEPLTLFHYNHGPTPVVVADNRNSGDSNLFVVPVPVKFQYMIYSIAAPDTSGNPYDMGIGDCPDTTPAHDCSQTNARIVLVCNTGNPGALVVNSFGPSKVACVQGVITLQPGVYVHLSAASNSVKAKCYGNEITLSPFAGSPIQIYHVQNGSLAQSTDPLLTATTYGAHSSVNGCAVALSLH